MSVLSYNLARDTKETLQTLIVYLKVIFVLQTFYY